MEHKILTQIAGDKRFTKQGAEDTAADLEQMVSNMADIKEAADEFVRADFDSHLNTFEQLVVNIPRFMGIGEALEALANLQEDAGSINDLLEEFETKASTFREHMEVWMDDDNDREDRTDAREELVGVASEIIEVANDLMTNHGIDIQTEY